jgi:phosphatidylserine/phosphatidylglycerophosphate/cardiolipin synthase-like enzyme
MTGGMNLGGEYFGTYHDMLFKVQGDTAYALHEEFAGDWQRGRGVGAITLPPAPQGTYGSEPIGIAVTSPRERGREHEIHETLLKAIDDAKVRIDMAYPYFSDDDVLDHLVAARARGVKVHVILTTHDGPMIHRTAVWSAHQTKRKGLDFHWWTTSYAHIKYTAIDDAFLAVGSSNADTLTFDNNQELDLLLTNPRTIGDFRQRIVEPDWAATPEVTDADVNVPASEKPLYALLEILDHYI